jgi:carbonic anhydrase/acetyltransferase-like protein (isoleucine patch superfamily)
MQISSLHCNCNTFESRNECIQKLSIERYKRFLPRVAEDCFIAAGAKIIGSVVLKGESSLWYNAVLRAEHPSIVIGKRSNVQDNCVIHTDAGYPVTIGDGTSLGHGSIIHGASVSSNCLVGMGAILLNGASIDENCLVAAGSLVPQGKHFERDTLIMGSPAVAKRKLTKGEIMQIRRNAMHYNQFRAQYLNAARVGNPRKTLPGKRRL